ncbi:YidC/Oxa1 family membrane protein insertase [Candidatus Uhrbacteria bacterium]|nr:YidC/Oxa1 family membrane protein insertase [Candidatus Uhrbacteria bacterium]
MFIWHNFLYLPLLNFLIYLYNGLAGGSLAVAVIFLTVILRVLLLPLSIASEKSKDKYAKIESQIAKISERFKNDSEEKKERIRSLLRENKVNYWSKAFSLSIQGLMLILLYQVFLGGFNAPQMRELYSWVARPDYVNTQFFSFNIAHQDWRWSAAVAVLLFLEIRLTHVGKKVATSDVWYAFGFPFLTFLVLAALPMAKSLFILTSMLFSFMIIFLKHGIKWVKEATD